MRKKRKIAIISLLVIVLIFVGLWITSNYIASKALPDYDADISLEGLKSEVKVYRDSFGVPHVIADNEEDLYRVTGYITAQDRLWQMDLLRRVTTGRLSEIFGSDMIDADRLFRALRISEKSDSILAVIDPEVKLALEAFSDGVNQYIEQGDFSFEFAVLSYEPEKWQAQHSVNLIGYMAWTLSSAWHSEIPLMKLQEKLDSAHFSEIVADMSLQKNYIFPDFSFSDSLELDTALLSAFDKVKEIAPPVFQASNNWAVSGEKSVNGKPIFANDMHLGLMIPGVWSQIHQKIPGELDVTGVILPGQPFVISGHNADIAWGMTNVMIDDVDFYIEKINPDNPNQYRFNGTWRDMEIRKEKIKTDKGETKEISLRFTHRGPVVSKIKDLSNKTVSMRWLGNENSNELLGVYLLNRAENMQDFKRACRHFVSVSQNIAYADTKGNIGLQTCAGIPKRKAPGYLVFSGETDEYDWKGLVPFDSLPNSYNPESGFVYSANQRTVGKDYPYYISVWFDLPNRAERIRQTLQETDKMSVQDFKELQNNQVSYLAEKFVPEILDAINPYRLRKNEAKAYEILERWDYNYHPDSAAPLIFEKFYHVFAQKLLADEMGDSLFEEFGKYDLQIDYFMDKLIVNKKSVWCDDITTDTKEDFAITALTAFKRTIGLLTNELGENPEIWHWGELHKVNLEHPLGKVKLLDWAFNLNRLLPAGGAGHTVAPFSYPYNEPFYAKHGASHRHIYPTADFDKSQSVIPTGISGIPASEHYCDQTEIYLQGKYHSDYFSTEKIEASAKYKSVFSPK